MDRLSVDYPREWRKAALFCPMRNNNLEVLMIRRSFWNPNHDRPMRYPGEWTFAGGHYDITDNNLLETAIREFREETGFIGEINNEQRFRKTLQEIFGAMYYLEFYTGNLVPENGFNHNKREVCDVRWFDVNEAINLIESESFEKELFYEYKKRKLDDKKFGIFSVNKRQFPNQTVMTLKYLSALKNPGGNLK